LTDKGINRNEALRGAVAYFSFLKSIGIDYVQAAPAAAPQALPPVELEAVPARHPAHHEELDAIRSEVEECESCGLSKTRNLAVFGTGSPSAKIMFVGEAPGADEDRQGKPFVGRAGQLLTKMIEAIDLKREDVFIANVLKCRPPNNRDPKPEEVSVCEHFLIRQVKAVNPLVLCALGTHAAQTLLKTDVSIGRLRGKFHDYHGLPLLPTYHPSFLLRSPSFKKQAWEDLQLLRDESKRLAKMKQSTNRDGDIE
jgi:DNA polymerase